MFSMLRSLTLILLIGLLPHEKDTYHTQACVSPLEYRLYKLVNDYRAEYDLPAIPLSPSLCYVAGAHVWDLNENQPDRGRCNMHSWSDKGPWTKCCYTEDHKRAECIWSKPSELTGYDGFGYEVAYYSSWPADEHINMPRAALEGWKSSPGHNQMILNRNGWKRVKWKAMGVGIYGNYAVVWFGEKKDVKQRVKWCR
jgi:uncharacterized protein YkwD